MSAKAEKVGIVNMDAIKDAIAILESDGDEHGVAAKLRAALAQNAQVDGEPVAWRYMLASGACRYATAGDEISIPQPVVEMRPLYLHAERARVPAGLRERIERAWHNHDEEGRVHISMGDARLLVEQVLAAAPSQPDTTGATP